MLILEKTNDFPFTIKWNNIINMSPGPNVYNAINGILHQSLLIHFAPQALHNEVIFGTEMPTLLRPFITFILSPHGVFMRLFITEYKTTLLCPISKQKLTGIFLIRFTYNINIINFDHSDQAFINLLIYLIIFKDFNRQLFSFYI